MSHDAVASIAFVQLYGLVEDDQLTDPPVVCRAFSEDDMQCDADISWVKEQVEEAHGDKPFVCWGTFSTFIEVDDNPSIRALERLVITVSTPGGPVWGQVIRL